MVTFFCDFFIHVELIKVLNQGTLYTHRQKNQNGWREESGQNFAAHFRFLLIAFPAFLWTVLAFKSEEFP